MNDYYENLKVFSILLTFYEADMKIKSKILIVDDESVGRQLLEAVFLTEDYELEFAPNGKTALQSLTFNLPDLILLDVMMPEMDGFEVCMKIRSDEKTRSVPIILITALDDRDSRKKGLESGANDYISKPFDRNEIVTKVKNLLQLSITSNHTVKYLIWKFMMNYYILQI